MCLHTIIVTLDNHCYTVALYIISMIYLCHYLFVHLTPTSLCHCLHPEEVSCEVNWGYGGQFGNNHTIALSCSEIISRAVICVLRIYISSYVRLYPLLISNFHRFKIPTDKNFKFFENFKNLATAKS